jgi:hypothetical protein
MHIGIFSEDLMRLSTEQKEAVRRLLALTETKQFALSSHSGLSPSVVSEMTNPIRTREIQPETWRKFVVGLGRVVMEFKGRSQDDQIRSDVDRLFGDIIQEEVMPILVAGNYVQDPGGWIASDARNYIERNVDRALARYLDRNVGASVTIQGPVQSGRSSAVRRLADQAQACGFAADIIDFQDFADQHRDASWTADMAARWVLEELGIERPKSAFSRADFGSEACQALLRGLETRTQRVRRAFLIWDSFDVLARTVGEAAEEDLLARWLIALRNAMPSQPPFDRMTLVVVANTPQWPMDGVMSNTLSHTRTIQTGKFGDEEVYDLFNAHDLGDDDFKSARGFALEHFAGHPLLTHVLASEIVFGGNLTSIKKMALALEGNFGRHWRSLWRLVCRFYRDRTTPEAQAAQLLRQAIKLVDHSGGDEINIAELRMLKSLGILDGGDDLEMCGYYRDAIETKIVPNFGAGE